MSGWKDWQQLEVVNESDFQNFVQDQVVQVYATSTARSTALGLNVEEGMVSYLKDTNSVEVYDGSAWAAVAPKSGNYIINGAFDFWQRGTSFVGLTADAYTADRWEYSDSGATATISRQTFTPAEIEALGFGDAKYYLRYQVTVGDANNSILQKIEDVRTLAGQTVTLSFWAKANAEITIDPYLVKYYGSGGSATQAVGNGSTVTIGTTWQRLTKTITIGSNSGKTINDGSYLMVNLLPSGSGTFTIDYWGVQLEAGSVATPFRRNAPSLQGELAACQRYYWRITQESATKLLATGFARTTTSFRACLNWPVVMRSTPTVVASAAASLYVTQTGSSINSTAVSFFDTSEQSAQLSVTVASGLTAGDGGLVNTNGVSSYVEASAEL